MVLIPSSCPKCGHWQTFLVRNDAHVETRKCMKCGAVFGIDGDRTFKAVWAPTTRQAQTNSKLPSVKDFLFQGLSVRGVKIWQF